MKLTLACFILIWSVQAEVGHTLKCYECATRNGFGPFSICPEPEEFQDTAPLVECNRKRGASFCIKSEGGKKLVFLSVFLFSLNILSFTENGSFYGCGRDDGTSFEEFRDNWERFFDEQPEMNGRCVRAARSIPDTYCFCDTDGCNAP